MTESRPTVRMVARYLYWRFLPHPCRLCACVIAPNADEKHAEWHYLVATIAWSAGGGKTKRPARPPHMKRRLRQAHDDLVVGLQASGPKIRHDVDDADLARRVARGERSLGRR